MSVNYYTDENGKETATSVTVEGQAVPTIHSFYEQIMATRCLIDRSRSLAWIALLLAAASLVLCIVTLCS